MTARFYNLALGLWLLLSAFLWPHDGAQLTNAVVSGILVMGFAAVGLRAARIGQYGNLALGTWLIVSSAFLPRHVALTVVNHVVTGMVVVFIAALPWPPRRSRLPLTHPRSP